jgi:hypothetical protein
MALSDADKTELIEIMSAGFVKGYNALRAQEEEETAKAQQGKQQDTPKAEGEKKSGNGISFAGFVLGE